MGSAGKIKLNTFDDLFGKNITQSSIKEIEIDTLHSFTNHPFKVLDNEDMADLVESIKEYGVLTPIIVRPLDTDEYEIISGHRRTYASKEAGLTKIPSIIKDFDDDEAINAMVDSNFQRTELLPSEKAFSYKMKLEAMKRQAGRPKNNSAQVGQNKKFSIELLADEVGESKNQIQRYIRLTYLNSWLLDKIDNKELPFNVGVELSYLGSIQDFVIDIMQSYNIKPTLEQAVILKNKAKENKLTEELVEYILCENKPKKISIKSETLTKYFPEEYSQKQMEDVIKSLLDEWSKNNKPPEKQYIDPNQIKLEY